MHKTQITSAYIRSVVDKTESNLESCLSVLDPALPNKGSQLLSFQSRLLGSLIDAESVYREIMQERKMLIGRKGDLSATWFRKRMAKLDDYRKCLKIISGAGRAIGDGFAWIFYRDRGDLIEQHLNLQRQRLLPPGLGGIGERVFLDKFPKFAGNLVLYHGTTSILRLGDFSFYDPRIGSIVGIGELKTSSKDKGIVQLHMGLIAQYPSSLASDIQLNGNSSVPAPASSQARNERLARQINQIVSAFKMTEKTHDVKRIPIDKMIDFSKLTSVLDLLPSDKVKYETVGKGLLLVAIACPGSIFEREISRPAISFKGHLDYFVGEVRKLVNPGASDNSLTISSMGVSDDHQPLFIPGTAPLCWWPLPHRLKRDLIFGRIVLLSIYNPSHFFEALRNRGYSVVVGPNGRIKSATKRLADRRTIALENFSFFQNLAAQCLVDEEVLDNVIGEMEREIQQSHPRGRLRVELKPQLLM